MGPMDQSGQDDGQHGLADALTGVPLLPTNGLGQALLGAQGTSVPDAAAAGLGLSLFNDMPMPPKVPGASPPDAAPGLVTDVVPAANATPGPRPSGTASSVTSGLDLDKAVSYLEKHATPKYIDNIVNGKCGTAVRKAIGAGGRQMAIGPPAKDFGPGLIKAGFAPLEVSTSQSYTPKKGDVLIYPAWEKHANGHIQMYDGRQWISDYWQHGPNGGIIPGNDPGWRQQPYAVYRVP